MSSKKSVSQSVPAQSSSVNAVSHQDARSALIAAHSQHLVKSTPALLPAQVEAVKVAISAEPSTSVQVTLPSQKTVEIKPTVSTRTTLTSKPDEKKFMTVSKLCDLGVSLGVSRSFVCNKCGGDKGIRPPLKGCEEYFFQGRIYVIRATAVPAIQAVIKLHNASK